MQSFCCKVTYDEAQTVAEVDYVREITAKKSSKLGVYGSFEHMLFLLNTF